MGWDSSRIVPWRRLIKEWAVYVVALAVVIAVVRRNDLRVDDFAWLIISLPVWLGVSAVLAKFGYQRKTMKEVRAEAAARAARQERERASAAPVGRARPAPTKRTSTGPSRPNRPSKSKRR